MKILSIETSCDETAISILEASGNIKNPQFQILANQIISQIDIHREYGGVFPTLAKREHAKNLTPLCAQALEEASLLNEAKSELPKEQRDWLEELLTREPEMYKAVVAFLEKHAKPEIDIITVTSGPGLEPALWVGINFAKALSYIWDIPVIPVNHLEGHILSVLISDFTDKETKQISAEEFKFPALSLIISGGHTELVLVKDWLDYEKIGSTRDDAVGEALDKVARILGLPYPGGPEISKLAETGEVNEKIKLPRPMLHSNDYDFSFAGLKTAVLYLVKELGDMDKQTKADIACEFENAVVDVLVKKTMDVANEYNVKSIIISGGVSANNAIRRAMKNSVEELDEVDLYLPNRLLSTDNAIMIGVAGYFQYLKKEKSPDLSEISADGNASV